MKDISLKLNDRFSLKICHWNTPGAMNGSTFIAKNEWAIMKDLGYRWSESSRYQFTTMYAGQKSLYFRCCTAKAAIQQALITYVMTVDRNIQLKDIYFTIVED